MLDTTDKNLLALLQQDAKQTIKSLAFKLSLSVTAVHERIKKLERNQTITQYVALIDKNRVNKSFMVLCHLKLNEHTRENIKRFEKEVTQLPEVMECYHVSGDYDFILKILVKDMPAYRQFLVDKLTALSGIGSTQSTFVIDEVKETTQIALTY
ncbi:Lrp/AsnC family transcriptional regulator [Mesonia sp. HuA40]|uniref:Lrp/AsnC family transcriptional regulator n=1 Tax=Mesonia sp. HuA40 TaxID=2602761 RepID=UPI0011CB19B8|nr:Lrp/AsnC family transcriptional regulator [Mesonia sp. HuA40]TXK74718.1 Lrp/AsnC family transcriptional regulator [Mesonia sp. HuA40]